MNGHALRRVYRILLVALCTEQDTRRSIMALTQSQLAVLDAHARAGDRIAYYHSLAEFGDEYGALALGVVLNDTISGASANAYFLSTALVEVGVVSKDQLAEISLQLMLADNDIRQVNNGEASVDDIQIYHDEVFGRVANVSVNAWTPDYYLRSFDNPSDRQAAWNRLIEDGVFGFVTISARSGEYVDEYLATLENPPISDSGEFFLTSREDLIDLGIDPSVVDFAFGYNEYISDLIVAGFTGGVDSFTNISNVYGPFEVGIPGAGQMSGGDQQNNELSGSSGDDVLIGFNGSDYFLNSAGSDKFYGLNGNDFVDYNLEQGGIEIEIGILGDLESIWTPVINQGRDVQRVLDTSSSWVILVDIELIVGSQGDDVLRIASFDRFYEINGWVEGELGDTIDVSALSGPISVDLETHEFLSSGQELRLENFENVIGTVSGDLMSGSADNNKFEALGGDDTVIGSTGEDYYDGGTNSLVGDTLDLVRLGDVLRISRTGDLGSEGKVLFSLIDFESGVSGSLAQFTDFENILLTGGGGRIYS